jgi:integrase
MPRSVKDTPMSTRAARERLAVRHQPYWRGLEAGAAVGYRKGVGGGMWLVRIADPTAGGGYRQSVLGRADDTLRAAGDEVLDWRGAETKARAWIAQRHRVAAGLEPLATPTAPYTVTDAIADYLKDYTARKGTSALADMKNKIDTHVIPAFGDVAVDKLTTRMIREWHRNLAQAPGRLRGGKVKENGNPKARQATANRIMKVLRAALNLAFADRKAPSDVAWRAVKLFRNADEPRVRWLEDAEAKRLVDACQDAFRPMMTAALLTGCDYGELSSALVSGLDLVNATLRVAGKRGGRTVRLSDEALRFFGGHAEGKAAGDHLFTRADGDPWSKSHQLRPMRLACKRAEITPAVSFHTLRHSYATRMLRRGMPMHQVSKQLGHKSVVITAKHYAHVIGDDVADSVRELSGDMGIG